MHIDWRLFTSSSSKSLKCVLLHNGNHYASLPITNSMKLRKDYEMVLENLCYHKHKLLIYPDLKIVNFLLGQQSGHTNIVIRSKNNHRITLIQRFPTFSLPRPQIWICQVVATPTKIDFCCLMAFLHITTVYLTSKFIFSVTILKNNLQTS